MYSDLYLDLAVKNWIIPREKFHPYLKALIDAGYCKRIMFGSDQMVWPEAIGLAIEGIESAEFLTAQQKADIFYNNAARFLGLNEETIAKHQGH
jgi:predicted TIM-barrel fold metal-dependent hydrolase